MRFFWGRRKKKAAESKNLAKGVAKPDADMEKLEDLIR